MSAARKIAIAIFLSLATLTACSTPYGGPSGCLVLGQGTCTAEGKTKP